jgi:hypothetical protein
MSRNDKQLDGSTSRRSLLKKAGTVGALGVVGTAASGTASASHTRELQVYGFNGHGKYYFRFSSQDYSTAKLEDSDQVTELDNGYTEVEGYINEGHEDIYWFEGTLLEIRTSVASGDMAEVGFNLSGDFEYTNFNRWRFSGDSTDQGNYLAQVPDSGSVSKYANCESCDQMHGDCEHGYYVDGWVEDGDYEDVYSKSNDMIESVNMKPYGNQTITMEHYYE